MKMLRKGVHVFHSHDLSNLSTYLMKSASLSPSIIKPRKDLKLERECL